MDKKRQKEKEYLNSLCIPGLVKEDFEMTIDGVYTIVGRGTVVTGTVTSGMCIVGENVSIQTTKGIMETVVTDIDVFNDKRCKNGAAYKTERVGLFVRGVEKEEVMVKTKVTTENKVVMEEEFIWLNELE